MSDKISHRQLHLVYSESAPQLEKYEIKTTYETTFNNENFVFNVIGSSHLIYNKDHTFCELISCEDLAGHAIDETIPLSKTTQIKETHTINGIKTEITITGKSLSEIPDPQTQDVVYKFGEKAYTMINIASPTVYETYHTYPEYDLVLYSRTRII